VNGVVGFDVEVYLTDSNNDGSFTVTFPDLPGCISEDKNLLTQWVGYLADKGKEIPAATSPAKIKASDGEFVSLVRRHPRRASHGEHTSLDGRRGRTRRHQLVARAARRTFRQVLSRTELWLELPYTDNARRGLIRC